MITVLVVLPAAALALLVLGVVWAVLGRRLAQLAARQLAEQRSSVATTLEGPA